MQGVGDIVARKIEAVAAMKPAGVDYKLGTDVVDAGDLDVLYIVFTRSLVIQCRQNRIDRISELSVAR